MANINLKIAHRINTVRELQKVFPEYGVGLDMRSAGHDPILHHDPFVIWGLKRE
jgi:hypothetical protein